MILVLNKLSNQALGQRAYSEQESSQKSSFYFPVSPIITSVAKLFERNRSIFDLRLQRDKLIYPCNNARRSSKFFKNLFLSKITAFSCFLSVNIKKQPSFILRRQTDTCKIPFFANTEQVYKRILLLLANQVIVIHLLRLESQSFCCVLIYGISSNDWHKKI